MRTGIILFLLLLAALSQVIDVKHVDGKALIVFTFAVMIGAANWKPGAIILAGIVILTTGTTNVRRLAIHLAPIGLGIVIGAGLQKGKSHERAVEPVRAIPVDRERGAHADAPARSGHGRPDGYHDYPSRRRSDGRPARGHD